MRYLSLAPLVLGLLPATARATVGSCTANTDSPSPFYLASCNSVCTESSNELTCDLRTLCTGTTGSTASIVEGYTNGHDLSAWGGCLGTVNRFCCVFDEGSTNVDTINLIGTDYGDEILSFNFAAAGGHAEANLQPWDSDAIHGDIQGLEGGDYIVGSNYAPTGYDEDLMGNRGADEIYGLAGGDFLKGGDGDDYLDGGYQACASNLGNTLDGGAGDDKLWYNQSENPNVPCPSILASYLPGADTDSCGDANDWTIAQMGGFCEAYITIVPAKCDGAN
jgi:Ca2+-binding RTX toxin-like protein